MTAVNRILTPPTPACPPEAALERLLADIPADPAGTPNPDDRAAVTAHVGDCVGCQVRMENLATGHTPAVAEAVKHIDRADPPKDSAYWRAIKSAEQELQKSDPALTAAFSDDDAPVRPDVSLDFLQPSDTAGMLGRLGSFDIKRVIGRGGMGVVLNGFDPWLQRDVAIKVLDPQLANNDTARQRFCREARAAAAVANDNIVAVYQVNEHEKSGLPYLVMQLVSGESLEQRLRRVGKLSVADAVRVGMQAASGLAAAHATGLIHRDVKPGNILLEAGTDKAKLTDFGLARAAEDLKLTRTGFVAGTPLYMAPEQARGDDIDARADLFSLGSVLYEALAGKPPFEGRTPLAVLRRVSDEAHPPLRKINPGVPEWLENLVDKLLAKEPADRYQTATEVAEALAFKLSSVSAVSPLHVPSLAGPCAAAGRLTGGKAKKHFCVRTAGTLVASFAAGTLLGAVGVGLMVMPGGNSPVTVVRPDPAGAVVAAVAVAPPDLGPDSVKMFPSQAGAVWAVALSPDGTAVASGVESGGVALWTLATGQKTELHPARDDAAAAHRGPVWAVDFASDGKTLVTASDDGTVGVWDVASGKQRRSIPVGTAVRSAAVNSAGTQVAVGDRAGSVWVFDLAKGDPVFQYDQKSTVNAVAFSPDGDLVAGGGADGSVVVRETYGDYKLRYRKMAHSAPVYGLSFSFDGTRLATASWSPDQAAAVWDVNTGDRVGSPIRQPEGAWSAQFSPCGLMFATAGQDGKTRLFEVESDKPVAEFGRHKGPVHAARFGRDGVLVTGGRDGTVRVWDVAGCLDKTAK